MSGNEQEWRDIEGWGGIYVGLYQISNDGCVRRVKGGKGTQAGRILKPAPSSSGYLSVSLSVDGKPKTRFVHQLVAQAFIPNPDKKGDVDHIDRNRVHNHVSNLRYATRSENLTNTAGRTNSGIKHIYRTHDHGYPVFRVAIKRGDKYLVHKRFYIKDRDEGEVRAEVVAYRNEKYAELGIRVNDRPADGDGKAGGEGTGVVHK
jgi:hypothetical protein